MAIVLHHRARHCRSWRRLLGRQDLALFARSRRDRQRPGRRADDARGGQAAGVRDRRARRGQPARQGGDTLVVLDAATSMPRSRRPRRPGRRTRHGGSGSRAGQLAAQIDAAKRPRGAQSGGGERGGRIQEGRRRPGADQGLAAKQIVPRSSLTPRKPRLTWHVPRSRPRSASRPRPRPGGRECRCTHRCDARWPRLVPPCRPPRCSAAGRDHRAVAGVVSRA